MKVKKCLSYVLGDACASENHILPVNAMQYAHGQLCTGGRDGVVKVWSAEQEIGVTPEYTFENGEDQAQDMDERILRLETAISSNALRYSTPGRVFSAKNVQNYNIHTDWINDIKAVHDGTALVTALADLLLKVIHGGAVDRFQNFHTDYVKKVSLMAPFNMVVSGGLDGNVVVWDLETLRPVQHFANAAWAHLPRSVYSVSNYQHVIAAGGPSNTINIYDRRIPTGLVRRLVGHQNTVRSLLMNGTHVLSGSSDTTVKLWDMRTFQVAKNFDMHDDAVWSLATELLSGGSNDAAFNVFYLGDKSGTVIKTDLAHLNDNELADDLDFPTFSAADYALVEDKVGLCTLVARADAPVVALCVADESVFVSTTSALERYHVPATELLATYQYLRAGVEHMAGDDIVDDDTPADQSDLNLDFYDIVSHLSNESADMPLALLVFLQKDDADTYTLMFLDTHGGPLLEYVNAYKDGVVVENGDVDETPIEILLNPVAANRIVTIPFNRRPFQRFPVTPKSIVAKRMVNNRRWVLALYINGDIRVWDVLVCREKHAFPYAHNNVPLSPEAAKERLKVFDALFQEWQTMDTLNNWCDVEIKAGKLLVSVGEASMANVEIYYDELVRDYAFLVCTNPKLKVSNDDRISLARIFLNSIFQNYALYEWEMDARVREDLRARARYDEPPVSEDIKRRFFLRKSSRTSIPQSPHSRSVSGSSNVSDLLSARSSLPSVTSDGDAIEDSISTMLQVIKNIYADKIAMHGAKKHLLLALHLYTNDPQLKGNHDDDDHYKPLIPTEKLPRNLQIIVFEQLPDLGNCREVCSFHMAELAALEYPGSPAAQALVELLRCNLPRWIGNPILYDKFPQKEQPKITFQVLEVDYGTLSPDKRIGGRAQKKIKRLPLLESSIKLTSQSMLRVNKILHYLTEKFDLRTSEMKDKRPPSEWLVLECRGEELAPNMTLQTIKTKIWKSSSDIELRFRRKFD